MKTVSGIPKFATLLLMKMVATLIAVVFVVEVVLVSLEKLSIITTMN